MASNDPYVTLGVQPGATPDELRAAYKGAMRAAHPDKNSDASGADVTAVQGAYKALTAVSPADQDNALMAWFGRMKGMRFQCHTPEAPANSPESHRDSMYYGSVSRLTDVAGEERAWNPQGSAPLLYGDEGGVAVDFDLSSVRW